MTELNRREAMIAALAVAAAPTMAWGARLTSPEAMGWDATSGEYTLPPLPYAHDALEPHVDAETMRIHHTLHHAGYVRGLNAALRRLSDLRRTDADGPTLQQWQRQLAFHAGGHFNHSLFWTSMAPPGQGGGEPPTGRLAGTIERDFGSFDRFVWQFKTAANAVEGSGWAWLVLEPVSQRLMVTQMENQQKLLFAGAVPLLGVDVWEHAYYLRYQNRRGDYLDAFTNVINWAEVGRRFDAAVA